MSGALTGLRVVDFSQYLAGPTVTMILADLGARVIRVDPPGGPRWKHGTNAALHRGKESIVLDLNDADDRATATALARGADIIVEGFRPGTLEAFGLGPHDVLGANPRVIYCSLPAFGMDDPRAQWAGWEGAVNAAAGLYLYPDCSPMNYVGDRTRDPIFTAVPHASSFAAAVACHSIAAALVARERYGLGQSVEVPLFDASFELIGANVQENIDSPPASASVPPPRRRRSPQLGHYRGSDGEWLELCLFQDKHLVWFGDNFMPQEWIDDGMTDATRMHNDPDLQERAERRFAELIATKPARTWEIEINDRSGASAALAQTAEQWLRTDTHARDAGAVIDLDDPELGFTSQAGYPVSLSGTPLSATGPRHSDDADGDTLREEIAAGLWDPATTEQVKDAASDLAALAGYTVVDVSQVLAGPTTSRVLAEYGASVVKIHSFEDRQLGMHLYTNSGKRSMMLNLKTKLGKELFEKLATGVDVFVQNFARGVADRLGVGDTDLRRLNPDVIYTSISAFGYDGYRGAWRGREQLGQGVTGMQSRLAGPDEAPKMAPWPYNDFSTGNWAAFGTLVAIFHRLRGGGGQNVHASLSSSGTFLQLPFMVAWNGRRWDEPSGQLAKGWDVLDRLYRASDRWFSLAAPTDEAKEELARVPELQGLTLNDPETLAAAFAMLTADEWSTVISRACRHASAAPLRDLAELMVDDVVVSRGLSVVRDHDGVGRMRMAGPSARLSRTPARVTAPVGTPGSDTAGVLGALGWGHRLQELVDGGVVREGLPDGAQFIGMFR